LNYLARHSKATGFTRKGQMASTKTTTTVAEITVERDEVHVVRRIGQQDYGKGEPDSEMMVSDDAMSLAQHEEDGQAESQKIGGTSAP